MTDEEYDRLTKECLTKDIIFHRYCYYILDEPRTSDSSYDHKESEGKRLGISYVMDNAGMVGYNENNPYHQEIVEFFKKYPKADLYLIQAWCWKDRNGPEHWDWMKDRPEYTGKKRK